MASRMTVGNAGLWSRATHVAPFAFLIGCVPQAQMAPARTPAPSYSAQRPLPNAVRVPPQVAGAQRMLEDRIDTLGRAFPGEVGIAVRDVQSGWTSAWNGSRLFPQQSVSKFWVAIAAMDRVDRGELDLDEGVTITRSDLTLFHQPIRERIGENGFRTTYGDLLFRAMTQSDNTANDRLMRRAGGPSAVRSMLARKDLDGIRFGPGERLLQASIAGLSWRDSYSQGRNFEQARAGLSDERRRDRFESYIDDPIDGATPLGLVDGLSRLQRGELLSESSTRRLLSIMSQTRTGRQRLTGGLAPGWRIAHKTGTGQIFNGTQAGYNDIGIVTSPDGRHYAVAVMIGRTSAPVPQRMALMQAVTRATIAYHDALRGNRDSFAGQRAPTNGGNDDAEE